jgi:hypothetical protein
VTMRGTTPPLGPKWSYPSNQLSSLSLSSAKSTFLDICPMDDALTDTNLDKLLCALDCAPLAVVLIASVGNSNRLSPTELLQCWNSEQTGLLNLAASDRLKGIDHSISLSLRSEMIQSTPSALRLLSIVAILPSGLLLSKLPTLVPNISHVNAAVRTLISVSLAQKNDGILQLLSPIRSYVCQHHPPDVTCLSDIRKFYFQLADKCGYDPGERFLAVRDEVLPEKANIEATIQGALSSAGDEDSVVAALRYSRYLYWTRPRPEILESGVTIARHAPFPDCLRHACRRSATSTTYSAERPMHSLL